MSLKSALKLILKETMRYYFDLLKICILILIISIVEPNWGEEEYLDRGRD